MTMQFSGKRKAWRRANYDRACAEVDDGKWERVSDWHWRRFLPDGSMLDFWPTTDKMTVYWRNHEEGTIEPETYEGAIMRLKNMENIRKTT